MKKCLCIKISLLSKSGHSTFMLSTINIPFNSQIVLSSVVFCSADEVHIIPGCTDCQGDRCFFVGFLRACKCTKLENWHNGVECYHLCHCHCCATDVLSRSCKFWRKKIKIQFFMDQTLQLHWGCWWHLVTLLSCLQLNYCVKWRCHWSQTANYSCFIYYLNSKFGTVWIIFIIILFFIVNNVCIASELMIIGDMTLLFAVWLSVMLVRHSGG